LKETFPHHALQREYQAAMKQHLAEGGETALAQAYKLGRKALEQGLGVVDMGVLYHRALQAVLGPARTPVECVEALKLLEKFFVESLSPFEMTHRGYRDAHVALRRLNEMLENDAKRIAHALHDESGQLLVATHLALEELARELQPCLHGKLQKVQAALEEMEEQLRRLSREIRPAALDDLGLLPALEHLAEGFSKRTKLAIEVRGSAERGLPPLVEIALYRAVQEALTNVAKHARATRVTIHVQQSPRSMICCSIQDDGKGFDVSRALAAGIEGGLGLPGIQERFKALGGSVEIQSSAGSGTEIRIQVPLGSFHADSDRFSR
jgi:signal transduction histidine kinase